MLMFTTFTILVLAKFANKTKSATRAANFNLFLLMVLLETSDLFFGEHDQTFLAIHPLVEETL